MTHKFFDIVLMAKLDLGSLLLNLTKKSRDRFATSILGIKRRVSVLLFRFRETMETPDLLICFLLIP